MKRVYGALCWWLILSWFMPRRSAEKRTYMTYDMTSICKSHQDRFKISMHHTGTGSTGILYASDYLSEIAEHTCKAVIRPPAGFGVVFNIEDVKLRRDHNYDCRDYIKIYNETSSRNITAPVCRECCRSKRVPQICHGRCGYEEDGQICEEYCGQDNNTVHMGIGRSIAVLYQTRCGSCTAEKETIGFRIVFTAYKILSGTEECEWPSSFQCDNGRCIWSGLTCDGHNNCGDMSDEKVNGKTSCGGVPMPIKAIIVASAVIATVLLGVVLAYLPRLSGLGSFLCRKKEKAAQKLRQKRYKSSEANSQDCPMTVLKNNSKTERLPKIKEDPPTDSEV